MKFEIVRISRGDIRLKSGDRYVRALGEALIASAPSEPSYVVYLNSLNKWDIPAGVTLTKTEKMKVIDAIKEYFQNHGSLIEFD